MSGSTRKNRKRQKKSRAVPTPAGQEMPETNSTGKEGPSCVAGPNCCKPAKWTRTENCIENKRHQIFFEVHKKIPTDVPCSVVVASRYRGHPLVSYQFVRSIRSTMYDRPEVKTVFVNGLVVYSRRMIRTIFRDKKRFYRMELMVIPEDCELYELNGWVNDEGSIPDIVLNSDWQLGHVEFEKAAEGEEKRILYM